MIELESSDFLATRAPTRGRAADSRSLDADKRVAVSHSVRCLIRDDVRDFVQGDLDKNGPAPIRCFMFLG